MGSKKGMRCVVHDPLRRSPYKVGQWLSRWRDEYYFYCGDRVYHVLWRSNRGLYFTSSRSRLTPGSVHDRHYPLPRKPRMKRRDSHTGANVPLPSALPTSVVLGKFPLLREWLTATNYDDGTIRQVGAWRVTTRGVLWHLTITDPDARARLSVVAESFDDALAQLEKLLGAPKAPWEPDPWSQEKKGRKGA